jgi:prepilin-type processing-associated H-X9-DG protein
MTTLFSIALGLLLQSTVLLGLGLAALRLVRRRGSAVQSLVGRATLAGVGLTLLLAAPLTGHIQPLWHVTLPVASVSPTPNSREEPTPPQAASGRTHPGSFLAPPPQRGEGGVLDEASDEAKGAAPGESVGKEGTASSAPTLYAPTSSSSPLGRPPVTEERGNKEVGSYPALAAAWGLGTALLLLWLVVCQWHLTRLRRRACPVTSGPAAEMLAGLTPHSPILLAHLSVRSPFLAGLRHPAIFLPTTYEADFSPAALRAILAHELAHLARRDNAWTLTARLLCALLWPQPLLWLLCRRLEQIGEEACDLAVLAQDCPPRAYADCLLTLAERHPLRRRERVLGAGVAPFRSSLGQRIGRILDKGTHAMSTVSPRLRLTIAALAVAAALGGAFLVSSAPAQSPGSSTTALTPQQQRFNAALVQDAKNLRDIGIALTQYTQDNDEFFPDAAHWMDELSPFLKDKTVFLDPFQPGARRYGYAFNRKCSGKALAAFAHPWETVAVFDSTLGTRNASDTGQSLRASAGGTTLGSNYLLVDGHVKYLQKAARPSFAIKWDRRFIRMTPAHPSAGLPARLSHPPRVISNGGMAFRGDFVTTLTASQPNPELSNARFLAGLTPVQGPGVVVTLNDSKKHLPNNMPNGFAPPNIIHDTDINQVVNELKAAGAEAIAVNDQRLVATSSIRCMGPTVFINFVLTTPPFVIKAIGSSKAMTTAMNLPGGVASQIKAYDPAMFSVREAGTLKLPAYSGSSEPRYARPAGLMGKPSSVVKSRLTDLVKQTGTQPVSPPPMIRVASAPKSIPDWTKFTGSHLPMRMTDLHCYINMKQIALAIWGYTYHHNDRFPDADRWMDEIKPYLKTEEYYHDPAAPNSERYSYAYNRSLSGAAADRVSNMSATVMLFESSLNVRNASDTGQSLIKAPRHAGHQNFVFVNIGGPAGKVRPSFALHIAPPGFYSTASPDQLAEAQKRTQTRLMSEQRSLDSVHQQFEGELRQAVPQANTSKLAQAQMLEMKIGLQVMGLQNIKKLRNMPKRNRPGALSSDWRRAERWTQSQLRPLLVQEAQLLPGVFGPQLARLHSVAASLTYLQFDVGFLQAEITRFNKETQRRRQPNVRP